MNNNTSLNYLRTLMLLLMMYLSFVYVYTLSPFQFSKFYFFQYLLFRKGYLANLMGTISFVDIVINLMMLLPVGFLIASLLKMRQLSSKKAFLITSTLGFMLSITIEFSQMFLPRTTSTIDILNNTIGASFGASLVYYKESYNPKNFFNIITGQMKRFFLPILLGYVFFAVVIFSLPPLLNNFNNWNSEYPLQVGNEATRDRPWEGTVYKISIFNRLLNQKEIGKYFIEGYSRETEGVLSKGLLLEYMFEDLPAENNSSKSESLSLNIQTGSRVKKLVKQNGISIMGNSILQTQKPAEKLVTSIKKSNQLSIAVWIKPQHIRLDGPARIVSLSTDPGNRNFTLGQSHDRINFRVRTPLTGKNGSKVSLTSAPILNSLTPQLIVATFYRGEAKVYYNGVVTSYFTHDTSFYLPLLFGIKKERYTIITFCFTLLFPLAWFVWGFSSNTFWKRLLLVSFVLIPSFISSFFTLLLLQHSIDVHLILLSFVIGFLVLLSGLFCDLLIVLLSKYNLP